VRTLLKLPTSASGEIRLCPAPEMLVNLYPINPEALTPLIEEDPENHILWYALGNILMLSGDSDEAIKAYRKGEELDPQDAKLLCNLGIAFVSSGKLEEADIHLKKAVLLDPSLELAHHVLALIANQQGNYQLACHFYRKVIRFNPQSAEILEELAQCLDATGASSNEIFELFERAYRQDKTRTTSRARLAIRDFEEVKKRYKDADIEGCGQLLRAIKQRYGAALVEVREIAVQMDAMIREIPRRGWLDKALSTYRLALKADAEQADAAHFLANQLFFSLGLLDEVYTSREELVEQIHFWKKRLELEGNYHYARFRLGALLVFEGKMELALEEFLRCRDALPPSKQRLLHLDAIVQFISQRVIAAHDRFGFSSANKAGGTWAEAGFDNPFELSIWSRAEFDPSQARLWLDMGFSCAQAQEWANCSFDAETAADWRSHQILDPKVALVWERSGRDPQTAQAWKEETSLPAEQAIEFLNAGIAVPGEAQQWASIFYFGQEAARWRNNGFSPEEASDWIGKGVFNPFQALEIYANTESREEEIL